jgi:DNA-binding Lrp family transcriptional regulator
MTGAYILINCSAGRATTVMRSLRRLGVKEVRAVTGLYDIIAFVEAANPNKLGELVVNRIQSIDGVERTMTMVALKM